METLELSLSPNIINYSVQDYFPAPRLTQTTQRACPRLLVTITVS